jgi:FtsP/CotA-like multicopper oxidase with cupredoxin domain
MYVTNSLYLCSKSSGFKHGLHISGVGVGDNVFTSIHPGESLTYTYDVPSNHMGGTFWYHPHHHGSSALQAGGGACGMLIVEDEPGSLPDVVKSMEEVTLVMQYIEPRVVARLQAVFNNYLWSGGGAPILLTNGQTAPVKAVQPGVWYRFRMLFTSIASRATISTLANSGTATCELHLLAKDGIYLNTAPRLITKAYLPAGGRADVMVRCSGSGDVNLNAEMRVNARVQGTFVAMKLAVSGAEVARTEIAPFSVYRPCYLVDTRTTVPSTALNLILGGGNPNTEINGEHFSSRDVSLNPTEPFTTGTLGEVTLFEGTFTHSLHIHVNPYQFSTMSPVVDEIYFQEGDWHDTFNAFIAQTAGPDLTRAVVRFWVDKYAGQTVVHCHMFQHEDEGMMNTYFITGDEGISVDPVARQIDPLCFSDLTGRGFS